ncbi:hypothetical protein NLX69_20975 [Rossellomorea sp. BNER]|nr:hypothetical protein [Rossellomorea sp. BNER]
MKIARIRITIEYAEYSVKYTWDYESLFQGVKVKHQRIMKALSIHNYFERGGKVDV